MLTTGFLVVVCFELIISTDNTQVIELYEDEVCNDQGWTCQKARNCPQLTEAIQRGEKPRTCGFNASQPIVCCPRNITAKPADRIKTGESTSSKQCRFYSAFSCQPPLPQILYPSIGPAVVGDLGKEPANPKEFPHMAMIGYGEEPDEIRWQCGGSLISERYVLSAAQCTFPSDNTGRANYVRLGDLDTASDSDDARPQQFKIVERINHPDYRPLEPYDDIALYKLDRNVTFDSYVRPVCLYENRSVPEGERSTVATGWGRIGFVGPMSKILMKVNLTQFEENVCTRLWGANRQLPRGIDWKSMICAGERDGSRDTCQGDSGGPLILQKGTQSDCLASQVGITSFGRQCGLPDSPGIYTRVAHYIPWIESIVWPDSV